MSFWEWRNLAVELANAWPMWAFFALLLLRKEIRGLAGRLTEFDFAGIRGKLASAQENVSEVESSRAGRPEPEFVNRLLEIAKAAPRGAVMEAWLQVEREAIAAVERQGFTLTDQQRGVPQRLVALLRELNVPTRVVALLDDLRTMRNEAVHNPEAFRVEQATEYVLLAGHAVRQLRAAGAQPRDPKK